MERYISRVLWDFVARRPAFALWIVGSQQIDSDDTSLVCGFICGLADVPTLAYLHAVAAQASGLREQHRVGEKRASEGRHPYRRSRYRCDAYAHDTTGLLLDRV